MTAHKLKMVLAGTLLVCLVAIWILAMISASYAVFTWLGAFRGIK